MILERELDQMRDAMNSKQIAIENLQNMRDVDDKEIIDLTAPAIANKDPEV